MIARPQIGSIMLAVGTAVYLIAFTNRTFLERAYSYFDNTLAMAAFTLGLTCLFAACLIALSVKYLLKPFLIVLVLSAAAGSWFMDRFGTVIDVDMIRSAVQTTSSEATHLITLPFFLHMTIFGVIPVLLICWVRVTHRTFLAKVRWTGNSAPSGPPSG